MKETQEIAAPKDKVLIEAFGSRCPWWDPTSEGTVAGSIEKAKAGLASLSQEDREWIFGKTAQAIYPKLAN